jgi:hypothetical protein
MAHPFNAAPTNPEKPSGGAVPNPADDASAQQGDNQPVRPQPGSDDVTEDDAQEVAG